MQGVTGSHGEEELQKNSRKTPEELQTNNELGSRRPQTVFAILGRNKILSTPHRVCEVDGRHFPPPAAPRQLTKADLTPIREPSMPFGKVVSKGPAPHPSNSAGNIGISQAGLAVMDACTADAKFSLYDIRLSWQGTPRWPEANK